MSGINDPFAVLGVSSSATEDEIKSAYRKLAKKYHPDLNPGDKAAEAKMREVNEAYTQALQIKKNGGTWRPDAGGYSGQSGYGGYGGFGGSGGQSGYGGYGGYSGNGGYGGYGSRGNGSGGQSGSNPFGDFGFGFDPFGGFYQQSRQSSTTFRPRNYANPDLRSAAEFILANRFNDALNLLNRVTVHNADWHALYARANMGLGNRVTAMDHAQAAARMAPEDQEYQNLLSTIEAGSQTYRQTQHSGYDFRSAICANPCLTCIAANMLLNCCLGGCGRYGMCC